MAKGIVLDLFACWLPKNPLPGTKKQAVQVFCERQWGYNEEEVDAALIKYAAYRKYEDGTLEGKMSEFTPPSAQRKRRRTGQAPERLEEKKEDEELKNQSSGEEKEEEKEHEAAPKSEISSLREQL